MKNDNEKSQPVPFFIATTVSVPVRHPRGYLVLSPKNKKKGFFARLFGF